MSGRVELPLLEEPREDRRWFGTLALSGRRFWGGASPGGPNAKAASYVTIPSIVYNLANTIMGVGIMALAGVLGKAGMPFGILLIVGFALLTLVSVQLLLDAAIDLGVSSYEDLATHIAGAAGRQYARCGMLITNITACIAFLVSTKDMASFAVVRLGGYEDTEDLKRVVLVVCAAALNAPLTLLRSIDALQYTSAIAIICLLWFCVVTVVLLCVEEGPWVCAQTAQPVTKEVQATPLSLNEFLIGSAVVMGSWQGINSGSLFPIWNEMRKGDALRGVSIAETRTRFQTGLVIALSMCVAFYLSAAIGGYFTFYGITTSQDLLMDCYDPARWYIMFMYVGMSLVCLFSYPILQFAARKVMLRMAGYGLQDDVPYCLHISIGFGILIGTTLFAVFASNLSNVLALGCGIAGPPVVFELPAYAAARNAPAGSAKRYACVALLIVGVVLHVLTIVYAQY